MQLYNPQKYKSADLIEAYELMDYFPFATVISVADGAPFVSHLPLTPKKVDGRIELIGHMAKANPQWRQFTDCDVTAIFHGPHTYITPVWYAKDDVPTWNYSVVHVKGKVELLYGEDLIECLKDLSAQSERHWPSGWQFSIPEDLQGESLERHIVGFKIQITDISYKKKLSQNRRPEDRAGVLKGLAGRPDEASQQVLGAMEKMYSADGKLKGSHD
ncbi:FMN-binding negative transcriptional regulator [Bdellovibrio bacteriovorus]|uniref:Transcriptional regulator protein Pai2 n=1 Tax=Bdellovibrio bacteriovorus (strain ATCC 15356 / DSM 50701 / NCIMB 9529 / HD100) TaxID=264462 RepID=Q6MH79_BDEBA|nr:FMN-binding negative transcriptional regulator [Bdellovibrio bacteriovorus]CAE81048.1 transcriptional regulator protein Pai2 [Bdellovibrio bacteriovorus HD100]